VLSLIFDAETGDARRRQLVEAVARSNASPHGPDNNIVAVKVQYPDALPLFNMDLKNLRGLAGFLSKTELAFDLVSAVDELSSQVQFEFDFQRCGSRLLPQQCVLVHITCAALAVWAIVRTRIALK
jgi:hypothetical protein